MKVGLSTQINLAIVRNCFLTKVIQPFINEGGDQFGVFLSVYFAFIWPLGLLAMIQCIYYRHADQNFTSKISPALDNLRPGQLQYLNHLLQSLRLYLSIIILVHLREHPSLQIILLLIFTQLMQIYLILVRPYSEGYLNYVALANELFIHAYLYQLLALLMIWIDESDMQEYCLIATEVVALIFNITVLGLKVGFGISRQVKRWVMRWRLSRVKIVQNNEEVFVSSENEGNPTLCTKDAPRVHKKSGNEDVFESSSDDDVVKRRRHKQINKFSHLSEIHLLMQQAIDNQIRGEGVQSTKY
ncbi:hypothetical protein FGO68_gene15953 [Halteria grandinella]|uniref:Uncharacterized protein n=1 Tax=Halteria grandinella TaxID=5974 RepID=A0A8J8NZ42_HALGN|nr:hypothetical protein FGO68_gene15953 [Halteria grandinella]